MVEGERRKREEEEEEEGGKENQRDLQDETRRPTRKRATRIGYVSQMSLN